MVVESDNEDENGDKWEAPPSSQRQAHSQPPSQQSHSQPQSQQSQWQHTRYPDAPVSRHGDDGSSVVVQRIDQQQPPGAAVDDISDFTDTDDENC